MQAKRKIIYDKMICYIPEDISNIQEYIKEANEKIYNIYNEKSEEANANMKVNIYYLIPDLNILKENKNKNRNKCDSKKIKEIMYTIYDLNNEYDNSENDNDNDNEKENIRYRYHILLDSMLYKMQQIQYIMTNSFKISYDIPSYMLLAIYFDCSNILVENEKEKENEKNNNNIIKESLEEYSKKVNNSIGKIFLEKYNVYNMESNESIENINGNGNDNIANFLDNVDIEYMEMIDIKIAADIYKVEEYLKRKYNIIKDRMEIIGR